MPTGAFAFTASCFASELASASCLVRPTWNTFCSWPLPPQPEKQLELPRVWLGFAVWLVVLVSDASAVAPLSAVCVAELEPPTTSYPAIPTGTLALTAFCLAVASASASCFVFDAWITFCSWPLPPQPEMQLELPPACVGFAVWFVPLELAAIASALFPAVWVAELEPPTTSCPAMLTGTLAFTAFCLAVASASAFCFVSADWSTVCDWPLPPQPDRQLELPPVCVGLAV